jgi:hypothetical protein
MRDLCRDFIVAASQAFGNAVVSNEPQIQELVALYSHDQQLSGHPHTFEHDRFKIEAVMLIHGFSGDEPQQKGFFGRICLWWISDSKLRELRPTPTCRVRLSHRLGGV